MNNNINIIKYNIFYFLLKYLLKLLIINPIKKEIVYIKIIFLISYNNKK